MPQKTAPTPLFSEVCDVAYGTIPMLARGLVGRVDTQLEIWRDKILVRREFLGMFKRTIILQKADVDSVDRYANVLLSIATPSLKITHHNSAVKPYVVITFHTDIAKQDRVIAALQQAGYPLS